jgi:hypothetical protein
MNSTEILPVLSGLALGAFLGRLHPDLRKRTGAALVLLLAFLATVASGEYRLSWGFVLVDILMVVVPACAGFFALRRRRWLH